MAIATQNNTLNIQSGSVPVTVHLSQGDVGNTLGFYIYNGSEPVLMDGFQVSVHGIRSDGVGFGPFTVTTRANSNYVTFGLRSVMTAVVGAALAELTITNGSGASVGTANFAMLVEQGTFPDGPVYNTDISVYQQILNYVQTIPASVRSDYIARITTVQNNLNAEASARQSADNTLQSNINAEASTRATADASLQSQIDQLVAPSGEAPSAAEVLNARIGADGVTYPTLGDAIRTQVTDLKNTFDLVFVTTKGKNLFNKSAVLVNKYCNVNGAISDYNDRYVTDYIPVEVGKIVTSSFLNAATHVQTQAEYSALCCYDSSKAVVSGGNTYQQTFTVPNGVAFVRITFARSMYVYDGMVELTDDGVPTAYEPYTGDIVSLSEDITIQPGQVIGLESRLTTDESNITSIKNDLDGILDTDIIFDQSGFIRYDGTLIANSNYISTDFVDITANGTFVKYKYRLRMFANTKIAYYDESKAFISAISPSESSTLEYVEGEVPYVDGAKYVRFCTASGITDYYVKYATVKNAVIGGTNDSNPCNYTGNDMSVFNKVLCIGDSLTSGTFNYRVGDTTGNYIEDAKYSYPTYLKKLTGCDTVNMGNGGKSSAEWYNTHQNDDLSGYDCAIIQLGVNDCIRYTTWGSTSETAFTNIINKLKAENKNIKIFVANIIPATSYSNAQYLAFSADLLAWVTSTYANDANVIPLDMQQYGHTKDSPAYNCGHLSAYGYWRLAQDYKSYIGWYMYMNQNKTVFKEVQFIGTDYYYDPIA